jgi:hypothetical protein
LPLAKQSRLIDTWPARHDPKIYQHDLSLEVRDPHGIAAEIFKDRVRGWFYDLLLADTKLGTHCRDR